MVYSNLLFSLSVVKTLAGASEHVHSSSCAKASHVELNFMVCRLILILIIVSLVKQPSTLSHVLIHDEIRKMDACVNTLVCNSSKCLLT